MTNVDSTTLLRDGGAVSASTTNGATTSGLPLKTSARLEGVDLFRCIAALAVIAVHAPPKLMWLGGATWGPILSDAVLSFATFAVPFFFAAAGYFAGASSRKRGAGPSLFLPRAGRVLLLLVLWSVIFVLIPPDWNKSFRDTGIVKAISEHLHGWLALVRKDPLLFFVWGGASHLWFLSALVQSYLVMSVLTMPALKLSSTLLSIGAVGLYILAVLVGAYMTTPIGLRSPVPHLQYSAMYALLPIVVGYLMGNGRWKAPGMLAGIAMFVAGSISSVTEHTLLMKHAAANEFPHIHVFGTAVAGIGMLITGLAIPELRERVLGLPVRWFVKVIAPLTLGIYLIHPLFIGPVDGILRRIGAPVQDLVFVVAFVVSLFAVAGMRMVPGVRALVR